MKQPSQVRNGFGLFDQPQWLVKKFKRAISVDVHVPASAVALVAGWVSLVV